MASSMYYGTPGGSARRWRSTENQTPHSRMIVPMTWKLLVTLFVASLLLLPLLPARAGASSLPTSHPEADLELTKTADVDAVNPGDPLTYTITVVNNGGSGATDVVVEDELPAGVTLDSAVASQGSFTDGVWTIGDLTSGASTTLTLSVTVNPDVGSDLLSNTAEVTATEDDPNGDNNQATVITGVNSADLAITKTASVVVPGDLFTYTIEVTNNGLADATGVVVTDTLPDDLVFEAASGGGTEDSGVVTWNIGDLLEDGVVAITLDVSVSASSTAIMVTNTVSVASEQRDPEPDNNEATVNTAVDGADLSIVKSAPVDPVVPDTDFTYSIEVTNNGPLDATGVIVTDVLPSGVSFVSTTAPGAESGGTVTWNIGALAIGSSVSLDLTVSASSTVALVNTASVTADQDDPDASNNEDSAELAMEGGEGDGMANATIQAVRDQIAGYSDDSQRVEKAVRALGKALHPSLWNEDGTELDRRHGHRVFCRVRAAVKELLKATEGKEGSPITDEAVLAELHQAVEDLTNAMRALAEAKIAELAGYEALDLGIPRFGLILAHASDRAQRWFEAGDAARDAGDYAKAIHNYRKAWRHAQLDEKSLTGVGNGEEEDEEEGFAISELGEDEHPSNRGRGNANGRGNSPQFSGGDDDDDKPGKGRGNSPQFSGGDDDDDKPGKGRGNSPQFSGGDDDEEEEEDEEDEEEEEDEE